MFKFWLSSLETWLVLLVTFLLLQCCSSTVEKLLSKMPEELKETFTDEISSSYKADNRRESPRPLDDTRTCFQNEECEVVQTTGGPVIGSTLTSFNGIDINVYYDIPYAAAPIGSLRFRPPVVVSPWKTPLIAKKPVRKCYQGLTGMKGVNWVTSDLGRPWTEDCLTLSVWAPKPKALGVPVLVNIHGGAFTMGYSLMSFTDGTYMASSGMVVVSLNYRLGVFGFFALGHPEAPGNVGLMDQTLALQWVQENAGAFGGDPARVTLIGASAGGASVGYHLLSPMSKGLFSAAIVMAGSPSNPWAVKEPETALLRSNTLLASLGCANSNISLSLDCIRQKNAEDILDMAALPDILTNENFIPTVDGKFVTEHPDVYLEAGRIASPVPVIIGTVEDDGSFFLALKLRTQDGRVFRRMFQDLIHDMDKRLTSLQVKSLDVMYTNWSNSDDPFLLRDGVRDLYGDYFFRCGINKLTESLARAGSNVFRYVFGHPMQLRSWMGTQHGTDFGPIMSPKNYDGSNEDNMIVTEEFRRRFVNFVINRDPNHMIDGTSEKISWPQYDPTQESYYHVTVNSSVKNGLRNRQCRFLEDLLPALTLVGKGC